MDERAEIECSKAKAGQVGISYSISFRYSLKSPHYSVCKSCLSNRAIGM